MADFVPLGGHKDIWRYGKEGSTEYLVKKTNCIEGAFYAFVNHGYVGEDRRPAKDSLWSWDQLRPYLSTNMSFADWQEPSQFATGSHDEDTRQISPEQVHYRRKLEVLRATTEKLREFLPTVRSVRIDPVGPTKCNVTMDNLLHGEGLHSSEMADGSRGNGIPYCSLDLKVGKVLWGLDATAEKKSRMEARAKATTSEALGLCVIAYRCRDPDTSRAVLSVTRESTRGAKEVTELFQHLRQFFSLASTSVLIAVIKRLEVLCDWLREQKVFQFRSSSLLVVYNSRYGRTRCAPEEAVQVKLIDFAHVSLYHSSTDQSTLFGVNMFKNMTEELLVTAASASIRSPKIDYLIDGVHSMMIHRKIPSMDSTTSSSEDNNHPLDYTEGTSGSQQPVDTHYSPLIQLETTSL